MEDPNFRFLLVAREVLERVWVLKFLHDFDLFHCRLQCFLRDWNLLYCINGPVFGHGLPYGAE